MSHSGKIIVTVMKATGLKAADVGGKSDPYAELCIGTKDSRKKKPKFIPHKKVKAAKTKVKKNTLDPVWNEKFEFEIANCTNEYLIYKVYDWDRLSSNDVIGKAHALPLEKLPQDYPLVWELPLEPKGILFLHVKAEGFGTPPAQYKLSVSQTRDLMN